ncbi:MAG: hypothetical protein ISS41_12000 [Candidatus Aminicenantes bacterium]|nr:hypothetical protein [Candidatus Aminicenantes bacterium]
MCIKNGKYIKCQTCGKEKYYSGCVFGKKYPPKYCSKECRAIGTRGYTPWNKGKKMSAEARLNNSLAKRGKNHPNWGKHLSKETREKIRQANLGRKYNEETKRKISKANKGKATWNKGKACPQLSGKNNGNYGKKFSEEHRKKLSESHKGKKHSASWYKKMRGRKLTEEHIKKAMRRRIPTSLEENFMTIIDKHHLPYAYVGDGSFLIERCNPDFININSKKIAIEVYARIYKTIGGRNINSWKRKRSKTFKKYGWNLIYFDETELNENNVLSVLQRS